MAAEQTTAIVLRTIEFSETSLIVSLLTRDFGRISAIAKGARRPKGPFEGALDLLAVCRVVVLKKSADTLDLLTEAKLHRRFRGGEKSLERVYAGYYVAEMLRLLTDEHDPHPEVYDLAIQTLAQIDGSGDVASTLLFFDCQILRLLGHAPGTDRCTDCGGAVETTPRISFSLSAGGVVCGGCRSKQQQSISVRAAIVEEIRQLQAATTTLPTHVARSIYGELRAIMNRYIPTVIGNVPRMQAFLPTQITPEASPPGTPPAQNR
ncbi:DNA repair protein RecO [Rubripirellula lacrimiformis]|uniref:DNA repair protein RecO n=1 Tax=Rubripirellula lacrimiformis TaxID=1930273 RepID=A0A517N8K3_9BACT|nr:DNA repair protein RecO [Rubripirellula lacrimiformis]QDT03461.1 DNA repair protein RecO [Rubripirellula lacrimiformis]